MPKKTPEMRALQNALAVEFFGGPPIEGRCVDCKKPVEGFRNEISKREYRISGLCQECQDSVFEIN